MHTQPCLYQTDLGSVVHQCYKAKRHGQECGKTGQKLHHEGVEGVILLGHAQMTKTKVHFIVDYICSLPSRFYQFDKKKKTQTQTEVPRYQLV